MHTVKREQDLAQLQSGIPRPRWVATGRDGENAALRKNEVADLT